MNDRMTKRERGLLKGALRRVFARSELRQKVLDSADIQHSDPNRPRVKKWSRCRACLTATPKYLMVVDHIVPVIPIHSSFEDMSIDDAIDRMWCHETNLQPLCPTCHDKKTALEREERKPYKKGKKDESKGNKRTVASNSKRASTRTSKRSLVSRVKKGRRS